MNEFIKFKKVMSIQDIQNILDILSIEYKYNNFNNSLKMNGVSNGLYNIDNTLCFIENISNAQEISNIKHSLIFTNSAYANFESNMIYLNDARFTFIKLLEYLKKNNLLENFSSNIEYQKKYISKKAEIAESAIIEENVIIEDDVIISAGCVIKNGSVISSGSIIRENCTIGCDGIALYKAVNGEVLRFPHVAGVYVGKNVEIGANSVVVKGTLSNTYIGNDTVIGNLCNIGHGVKIGKKVWLSVGGMIGGNCIIEDYVTMGLSVSLKDNLFIAQGSTVGMGSIVTKSLKNKSTVFGNPAKLLRPLKVGPNR